MVPEPQLESALVLLNPRAAGGRAARIAEPLRRWLEAQGAGVFFADLGDIELRHPVGNAARSAHSPKRADAQWTREASLCSSV